MMHKTSLKLRKVLDGIANKNPFHEAREKALITAFLAKFILLRECKRCKIHRKLEELSWNENCTLEELIKKIKKVFVDNQVETSTVNKDIALALHHAQFSVDHFAKHYLSHVPSSFQDALRDYSKSNFLLFGQNSLPIKARGWRIS